MENKLTLYNISNKFVELLENEEITEENKKEIGEELAIELQKKSTSIIGYAKNTEEFINSVKAEEKRLATIRKQAENKLDRFKKYVKENMEKLDLKKIETPLGKLTIANSPIKIDVINEEEIPAEFIITETVKKVDKEAIKKHFTETGEIILGVDIQTQNTNLRIK